MRKRDKHRELHLLKRAKKTAKRRKRKQAEEKELNVAFQELASSGMLKEFRKRFEEEMADEEDLEDENN